METLFSKLSGETLSAVIFVADYLRLDFDGLAFTSYVWPVVTIESTPRRLEDPGYRDALCAFIGHKVESTEESPRAGLVIRFPLGSITVNPDPGELVGPEIAQLRIHDPACDSTEWMIWRPGEDVFEGT
ncbi:type 2 periplasmic-binding domain-containing protein [Saccharomonospora cyanea]|uniref:Uncharacterized protein n=1 Tax=Saccharomonospora cyanea NA-134 TaxID=882082 RepID=H5XIK3_9PSEU|nr:hypothetical protein [Saccharomonospora cyanea]EHR62864.1 hypothetical protein SaccyDRAFT_4043 [Saccharomonospora cyanea NA-134]